MIRLFCLAALTSAVAAPALAAGPLQITTSVLVEQRSTAPDGTVRTGLVAPIKVVPGDRVTLVLTYRNTGTVALGDVVLANPVPHGMRYRGVPAGTRQPELSVDGRHFAAAAALRVPLPGGGGRAALPADVTAVRWRLASVPAGASGWLSFDATLN